jgi:hypothetical protein
MRLYPSYPVEARTRPGGGWVQATLPTHRTFERSALVYQGWSHAVASKLGSVFTLVTLAFSIMSFGVDGVVQLLLLNLTAVAVGIVIAFLWASAITFRSAVLLDPRHLPRTGAAGRGGGHYDRLGASSVKP